MLLLILLLSITVLLFRHLYTTTTSHPVAVKILLFTLLLLRLHCIQSRVLFMPGSLSQVWRHSVPLIKFKILKDYPLPHTFYLILTKLHYKYGSMGGGGGYRLQYICDKIRQNSGFHVKSMNVGTLLEYQMRKTDFLI